MAPEQIGSYEILSRLSDGFVYKARDTRNGAVVALKVLPAWMRSQEALSRFEREIKVERAMEHKNLVRFHDVGQAIVTDPDLVGSAADASGQGRVFFLAKEYVEGKSLKALLEERQHRLPLALAINVAIQVAEGLGVVHSHGIVHRNVNPNNVHVSDGGEVKLLDFGLVKILKDEIASQSKSQFKTASGQLIGTAPYLAPEQIRGEGVDARSDLFSLGVLLYHMVTGSFPFPHENLLDYFHAIDSEPPKPMAESVAEVPKELDRIVSKLLAKEPADRYASTSELIADLSEFLKSPEV